MPLDTAHCVLLVALGVVVYLLLFGWQTKIPGKSGLESSLYHENRIQPRDFRLFSVYTPQYQPPEVDIIAIHGLNTTADRTWTFRARHSHGRSVDWLRDVDMLPKRLSDRAQIWCCDWPAPTFENEDLLPKTISELAEHLLTGLEMSRHRSEERDSASQRPIVFIASCLGGLVLVEALRILAAGKRSSDALRDVTYGAIFLATPFRGTSFQRSAPWLVPMMRFWAQLTGRRVTSLIGQVQGADSAISKMVRDFTNAHRDQAEQGFFSTFYEGKATQFFEQRLLPAILFPSWLKALLGGNLPLVDEFSASLDVVRHAVVLNRSHVMMNKFAAPEEADFDRVAGAIKSIVGKVLHGTLLEQADSWVTAMIYNSRRLQLDRLSGERLSMESCYINLAVVRKASSSDEDLRKDDEKERLSPFAFRSRIGGRFPSTDQLVSLSDLFDDDRLSCEQSATRRVWIWGPAGVGKTTLCKKIVYEFIQSSPTSSLSKWKKRFDRILWLPLRNLKQSGSTTLEALLQREFFAVSPRAVVLTKALLDKLEHDSRHNCDKTLFILDGLDELSRELSSDHSSTSAKFLRDLLDRPNVIVTSRPNERFSRDLGKIDLALEVVGFSPDQVDKYIASNYERAGATAWRTKSLQDFIRGRPHIASLASIPIQLDALCCTWMGDPEHRTKAESMTDLYILTESRLWREDLKRLQKLRNKVTIDPAQSNDTEIESTVAQERNLMQSIAFIGLQSDLVDFDVYCRDEIMKRIGTFGLKQSLDETLASISVIRSSDSCSQHLRNRAFSYHFIHLTYQEYFAARYFVRCWLSDQPLVYLDFTNSKVVRMNTRAFLAEEKFTPRCEHFWRFVAGILLSDGTDEQLCEYFRELDTLDPALSTYNKRYATFVRRQQGRILLNCTTETTMSYSGLASNDKPKFRQLTRDISIKLLKGFKLGEATTDGV